MFGLCSKAFIRNAPRLASRLNYATKRSSATLTDWPVVWTVQQSVHPKLSSIGQSFELCSKVFIRNSHRLASRLNCAAKCSSETLIDWPVAWTVQQSVHPYLSVIGQPFEHIVCRVKQCAETRHVHLHTFNLISTMPAMQRDSFCTKWRVILIHGGICYCTDARRRTFVLKTSEWCLSSTTAFHCDWLKVFRPYPNPGREFVFLRPGDLDSWIRASHHGT